MSILAGVLIVVSIAGAAIVAVAAPLLLAVILRDIWRTEESGQVETEPSPISIAMKRGGARAFVVAGGVFWSLTSFAGLWSFRHTGLPDALLGALYPLLGCAATLVIGWYFERAVAVLLVIAAQAVVVWGVLYQFESGVWMIMTIALIGPMLTSAVLYWLARGDQEAYEEHFSFSPELGLLFAARTRLEPATVSA